MIRKNSHIRVSLKLALFILLTPALGFPGDIKVLEHNGKLFIVPPDYIDSDHYLVKVSHLVNPTRPLPAPFKTDYFELKLVKDRVEIKLDKVQFTDHFERQKLRVSLFRVYQKLEEWEKAGNLALGSAELVSSRLAEAIPCEIGDSLYFAYGMMAVDESGVIDLQAGMHLRVDYSEFHRRTSGNTPRQVEGYVPLPPGYFLISRRLSPGGDGFFLSFDPFFGQLQSLGAAPRVDTKDTKLNLLGSLLDLHLRGRNRRYYRLIYPVDVLPSEQEVSQTFDARNYVLLVGANSLCDLEKDFPTLPEGALKCVPSTPSTVISMTFRGRSFIVPQIAVFAQGKESYVSVGTTLQDLLATGSPLSAREVASKVRVRRLIGGKYVTVKFSSDNPLILTLPLLKGDTITWSN